MRSHDAAARPSAEQRAWATGARSGASDDVVAEVLANWRGELTGTPVLAGTGKTVQAQVDIGRGPGDGSSSTSGRSNASGDGASSLADDGALFASALDLSAQSSADAVLGTAADIVGGWISSAAPPDFGAREVVDLEFSVESSSLGPLQGRVSIVRGKADVELQAFRPATAAALRSRQSQLQQMVWRDSSGDVELRIL